MERRGYPGAEKTFARGAVGPATKQSASDNLRATYPTVKTKRASRRPMLNQQARRPGAQSQLGPKRGKYSPVVDVVVAGPPEVAAAVAPSMESVAVATRAAMRRSISTSCSGEKGIKSPSPLPSPPLPVAVSVGAAIVVSVEVPVDIRPEGHEERKRKLSASRTQATVWREQIMQLTTTWL